MILVFVKKLIVPPLAPKNVLIASLKSVLGLFNVPLPLALAVGLTYI